MIIIYFVDLILKNHKVLFLSSYGIMMGKIKVVTALWKILKEGADMKTKSKQEFHEVLKKASKTFS